MRIVLLMTTVCSLFIFTEGTGQELKWKVGQYSFLDNMEYYNSYSKSQTIFGTQTFAQSSIAIDKYNEFTLGFDFLYEFGDEIRSENLYPRIYYHHSKEDINLYMGAFPRYNLKTVPPILLNDTIQYFRPNMEGVFLEINRKGISQNIWIDWLSKQSENSYEIFLLGSTGKYNLNKFFVRYDFTLHHLATTATFMVNDHIRDNSGLNVLFGTNFVKSAILDTFYIATGLTISADRTRNVYDVDHRYGSITELLLFHKQFGIRSTNYIGEGQIIVAGDKLYSSEFYNRTDLIWRIFKNSPIKGLFEFSFHFLPGILDFSQKFTIYLDIEGTKKLYNKNNN